MCARNSLPKTEIRLSFVTHPQQFRPRFRPLGERTHRAVCAALAGAWGVCLTVQDRAGKRVDKEVEYAVQLGDTVLIERTTRATAGNK